MRLLFDENLSPRLVDELATEFPGSLHIRSVGLRGSDDVTIWEYAGKHGFVIVSKDNDFRQLSFLKGRPECAYGKESIYLLPGNCPP